VQFVFLCKLTAIKCKISVFQLSCSYGSGLSGIYRGVTQIRLFSVASSSCPILLKLISSEVNYRSRVESEDFSSGRTLSCRQAISLPCFPYKL